MKCDEAAKKSKQLFDNGFHCSQAVLSVCAEFFEAGDVSLAIAAVSPFGGGLASTGRVCGCLPGALAAIGVVMGKRSPEARDDREMWRLSYRMVKEFEKITSAYGSINCCDIAGVNWKDKDEVVAFRKNVDGRRGNCHKVLQETVRAMCTLVEEYRSKK
jgi:C_GCAxxG_C_C family probable redox protein